jgi:type IV secretion system protein VirB10
MSETSAPPPAPVGGARAPLSAGSKIGLVAGAAGLLAVLYWMGGSEAPRATREDVGGSAGPAGALRSIVLPPPDPPVPPVVAASLQPPFPPAQQPPRPYAARAAAQPARAAPIMAWEAPRDAAEGRAGAGGGDALRGEPAEDALAARLQATHTPPARARRLRDPDLTVTMGAVVPCTRTTPVNTQLPGFVACTVPVDVYGTSGRVVLLGAGTRLVGQIRRSLEHGTNRAFVLWTRAETPDHVVVELASPGTDALGQNGIAVDVHTNFWARFGGAVMLSFIDAGLQAAAIAASNAVAGGDGSGPRLNFFQLQSGGRGAAARALDATVNIPPWGTAPQGEAEAVFVARDLDFSDVYRLRATGR